MNYEIELVLRKKGKQIGAMKVFTDNVAQKNVMFLAERLVKHIQINGERLKNESI